MKKDLTKNGMPLSTKIVHKFALFNNGPYSIKWTSKTTKFTENSLLTGQGIDHYCENVAERIVKAVDILALRKKAIKGVIRPC